jgi:outer membrane protein assembly factor BamB
MQSSAINTAIELTKKYFMKKIQLLLAALIFASSPSLWSQSQYAIKQEFSSKILIGAINSICDFNYILACGSALNQNIADQHLFLSKINTKGDTLWTKFYSPAPDIFFQTPGIGNLLLIDDTLVILSADYFKASSSIQTGTVLAINALTGVQLWKKDIKTIGTLTDGPIIQLTQDTIIRVASGNFNNKNFVQIDRINIRTLHQKTDTIRYNGLIKDIGSLIIQDSMLIFPIIYANSPTSVNANLAICRFSLNSNKGTIKNLTPATLSFGGNLAINKSKNMSYFDLYKQLPGSPYPSFCLGKTPLSSSANTTYTTSACVINQIKIIRSLKLSPDGYLYATGDITLSTTPVKKTGYVMKITDNGDILWERTIIDTTNAGYTGGFYDISFTPDQQLLLSGALYNNDQPDKSTLWIINLTKDGCFNQSCKDTIYIGDKTNPVKESGEKTDTKLFPNPTGNFCIVEVETSGVFSISDVTGHTLKTGRLSPGANHLDLADLKSGIYFIKITASSGKSTLLRLMVQ